MMFKESKKYDWFKANSTINSTVLKKKVQMKDY